MSGFNALRKLLKFMQQTGLDATILRQIPKAPAILAPFVGNLVSSVPVALRFVALPLGIVIGGVAYSAEKKIRAPHVEDEKLSSIPVWQRRQQRQERNELVKDPKSLDKR